MAITKKKTEGYLRVHTRKIDREVARRKMKRSGMVQFNKHGRGTRHGSYFSYHWREYAS